MRREFLILQLSRDIYGVYTIKFIECLALGSTFEGLSDEIIQDVRRKLAAEIYDAFGEPQITDLFSDQPK